jgi:transcriptional antiterminator NusG
MDWYSLFVITGEEENVAKWLQFLFSREQLTTLIPKRKLVERRQGKNERVLRKMFPGYVLINTRMDNRVYYSLKKIPNLIRIVNCGEEKYTKISQKEINCICRLLGDGDVLDYSNIYFENSRVIVKSGPLKGMEGMIKSVDKRKNRVKIRIPFMGLEKEIDVGIEIIEEVNLLNLVKGNQNGN